jgi:hypothetical protein
MTTTREAHAVQFTEDSQGEALFCKIGGKWYEDDLLNPGSVGSAGSVTRITVTDDLPGMHCFMERVRVFVGEKVVLEAPLHQVECVQYHTKS